MTAPQTHLRSATLDDMVALLRTNAARRVDAVAPVTALRAAPDGTLVVAGADVQITDDGVTQTDGIYRPTSVCNDGLASRLEIPPRYLDRMYDTHPGLWADNINGWLEHERSKGKKFLVRALRAEDGTDGPGVARAFLSDSYKPVDNLDVLFSVLEGINEAGVEVDVRACHLTDTRMYVQFACEQIAANALPLVRNYRSPFNGKSGEELPMMFAGFEASNSEVGLGRVSIAPRVTMQVCDNGMTRQVDAFQAQHLGRKLEAGVIEWSETTQRKNLELIRSMTVDAVRKFLSPEYVQGVVDRMRGAAATELEKPEETIKVVTKELRYTEDQQAAILRMFIKSGDTTAMGVAHAVTAAAQEIADADAATAMESDVFRVLELAAKHA